MSEGGPLVPEQVEIVIVGGGMVGMTIALMLAQQQIAANILLVEGHSFSDENTPPSFDARSTAISAGSVRLLKQLKLWPALALSAEAIRHVVVSDKGNLGYTSYCSEQNGQAALGYVVENAALGRALHQAVKPLNNVHLMTSAKVNTLSPFAGGMAVEIEGPEGVLRCRPSLVILADGADSTLASTQGIRSDKHHYGQHAIITNVVHSKPHEGRAFERFTEQGPQALLPTTPFAGKHRSALVWTHCDADKDAVLTQPPECFLDQLQTTFGYELGRFTECGERHAYSLNLLFAREQVRSSLVLMGNAAHFLHPVAGQGFNLALRDCAELVLCLKDGQQAGRVLGNIHDLNTYMENRRQDQYLTTELSHRFIELFGSASSAKRTLRTLALSAMNKTPLLNHVFFQQMMGLAGKGVNLR